MVDDKAQLLNHLDQIHTTAMGVGRIKKNLRLNTSDVIAYCRNLLLAENCHVYRKGKNWYCKMGNVQLTINASSYTVITAHIVKRQDISSIAPTTNFIDT